MRGISGNVSDVVVANLGNVLNAVARLLVLLALRQMSQGFTHIAWPRLFQPGVLSRPMATVCA